VTVTVDASTDLDRTRFFIDNEWVEPRGSETHHAVEAATEDLLGTAVLGTDANIDAGVKAARKALDEGPRGRTTAAKRAAVMRRFADALTARAEATSTLVSRENGMPIGLSSAFNGAAPAGLLQMYAGLIEQMTLEEVRGPPLSPRVPSRASQSLFSTVYRTVCTRILSPSNTNVSMPSRARVTSDTAFHSMNRMLPSKTCVGTSHFADGRSVSSASKPCRTPSFPCSAPAGVMNTASSA
jgi:hypothetical protein